MKVDEVPQDLKFFKGTVIRDLSYAVDENGNYKAVQSDGWAVKNDALQVTLDGIADECEEIRQQVLRHEVSPLAYHLRKGLMDEGMLADNSGVSKRTVKKLMDFDHFAEADDDTLGKIAEALRISVEQLKTVPDQSPLTQTDTNNGNRI